MDIRISKLFNHRQGQRPHNYDVVLEMEYFINLKLKISCGLATSFGFKPVICLHYKDKQFIGFDRDEWIHLMRYKQFISDMLNDYDFLDSTNFMKNSCERDIEYTFQYKNGKCYLFLQQGGYKIKINSETWRSLTRIGNFLTTILSWNNILRKQVQHFYYNYYIPKCSILKKSNIQLSEIDGIYEKDVANDFERLCYEFSKKMQNQIKNDVKIYRLLLRAENK